MPKVPVVEVKGKPRYVPLANKRWYLFEVRNGVSLAFVEEIDLHPILQMTFGCCGRTYRAFRVATEEEVNRWLGNRE